MTSTAAVSRRTPFYVLAVGKCTAVKSLLERITNAVPYMELHTALPDGTGSCELHGHVPDLIFVDADSPYYDAAQLCESLKRNHDTRTVPLIVVSASAKACEAALSHGADDFVTPTTLPALLLRRIESLVLIRQDPLTHVQFEYSPSICTPAVVLFADLRGYTRMCESLPPSEVVILLQEYFSLITLIILEHQGTVFNTAGDCLMAGFDLSHTECDAAKRALLAGKMMLNRFAALAASWLKRCHVTVGLGVGLNAGDVATAVTGFPPFTNLTLVGDTVNVASRLCQRARAGEIVLSASFKEALGDQANAFAIVALDQVELRGRSGLVNIFCLPAEHRLPMLESNPGIELGQRRLAFGLPDEPCVAM